MDTKSSLLICLGTCLREEKGFIYISKNICLLKLLLFVPSGGVQQQRRCIPGTMSGLGASGFPPRTDLPLVDNFNNFATVDSVNSITGSLNPNSNSPSLTVPQKRPRRH